MKVLKMNEENKDEEDEDVTSSEINLNLKLSSKRVPFQQQRIRTRTSKRRNRAPYRQEYFHTAQLAVIRSRIIDWNRCRENSIVDEE